MEIKFKKRYPDFSRVPYCVDLLAAHKNKISPPSKLYIALFLDQLPANSHVVYASPSQGLGLVALAPFLGPHRVKLVENYSMREQEETISQKQTHLRESIAKTQQFVNNIELIEADFVEIWETFSDVDFLLLDGPPNTANFEPFSDNFIYMMHDINQRLRADYYGGSYSLTPYLAYLCRADDAEQFMNVSDDALHPVLKAYRDIDRTSQLYKDYGPHGWLIGKKT